MASILYKGKVYIVNNIIEFKQQLEKDGYPLAYKIAENYMKEFNPQPRRTMGMNFAEVVTGAKAILDVTKGEVVEQSEITRRASICTSCPLSSTTTDCIACGFGSRLSKFISDLKTKVFESNYKVPNGMDRNYCKVCGCSLAMMIPSKMSAFKESDQKQAERPDHCWVKKTSINYIP